MQPLSLSAIPLPIHEQVMRLAMAAARTNPLFPFGAVILRAADGQVMVMATGANKRRANPILHREIVAINDYVARHGNQGWGRSSSTPPASPAQCAWPRWPGRERVASFMALRSTHFKSSASIKFYYRLPPSWAPRPSTLAKYSATC
ncbi:MAG: hypothetical protein JO096_00875 [Alphaproteobacteria bacterium]|nr:hypothetical protein [Alphaproteobacteria bacterium]